MILKLCLGVFFDVLLSRFREEFRGELGGKGHGALDLHFALDESHLGVQLAIADLVEVFVGNGEKSIELVIRSFGDAALAVLQVDVPLFDYFAALLVQDVDLENSADFLD